MIKAIKKVFGGINLSWPKLVVAAVAAGVLTAAFAIIPGLKYTSFHAITTTTEAWILFGIIIIMNSKSNIDSALKCFVFFLISQPLIYLLQVPFSWQGWGLFGYYKFWFIWTVLCLPMGYIGYYMKKGKWWGYLILLPMIALTVMSYEAYFSYFQFYAPKYILVCVFCACAAILYPVVIFDDRRIRTAGALISAAAVIVFTVIGILNPPVYSTEIMGSGDEYVFDDTYSVSLADEDYGDVKIVWIENVDAYMVHADFKKGGETVLTVWSPDGETKEFDLLIEIDTYKLTERKTAAEGAD